jgi:glycosyltransferase involved in cell wall biosynthesis
MRILFLTDNFPPETNAPATRTFEHARVWVGDGHEVTVITCAPNFPAGKVFSGYRNAWRSVEYVDDIRVVRVKTYISANQGTLRRVLDYLSFMVSATFFSLFERRPDVVVATSPQFFTAVAGFLVSILRWRRWVFELRDLWPDSVIAVGAMRPSLPLRLVEKLELFLYRRAEMVVSVTHAFRNNLISRGIDGSKIKVVTNGVDVAKFASGNDSSPIASEVGFEDRMIVGYIGTHGMAHALDNVLDAADLLKDNTEIGFLFAGDGAERQRLQDRAANMPNIRFIGPQPRDKMPDVWSACDVALVSLRDTPTFQTVIPSKIFEAMAMARPILMAVPEGEATDIVLRDEVGVIVAPEDPSALRFEIERLAQDRTLRVRLGQNGASAVKAYDRTQLAREMLAHLVRIGV